MEGAHARCPPLVHRDGAPVPAALSCPMHPRVLCGIRTDLREDQQHSHERQRAEGPLDERLRRYRGGRRPKPAIPSPKDGSSPRHRPEIRQTASAPSPPGVGGKRAAGGRLKIDCFNVSCRIFGTRHYNSFVFRFLTYFFEISRSRHRGPWTDLVSRGRGGGSVKTVRRTTGIKRGERCRSATARMREVSPRDSTNPVPQFSSFLLLLPSR